MDPKQLAAFAEYVVRPLSEDWRKILEELRALQLPITPQEIRRLAVWLGCWHLLVELLRAVTYVTIAVVVCHTVAQVLCSSPLSFQ